ncbi:hypothetical protein [Nonomuraea rhodomycinica]|uniref:Uncharacterized protein n=1 Tax=Nonomuraea rhodomycinica TaxID=1712872 RepID=A0A7Y6MFY6_9ACTN|nr:hypothetical protein [Nonomuraea rhodomycinica]NUW45515.1 hypothetical protein [Nonomuraea rhodomycinica]
MSDDDNVVSFRSRPDGSVPPPPLPPEPTPQFPAFLAEGAPSEPEARPAGTWPSLPRVGQMAPPLALMMPALPTPTAADDEEEGAFAPPQPEDPDNPTPRDTLQLAVALMTAMGVAAAQGMWHRARHRSALADQARAAADKATAKAAAAGAGTRAEGKRSGLLTRSHQEGAHRKPHGPRGGGRGAGGHTGHDGERKPRKAPKGGLEGARRPGDGKSGPGKAPKAGPGGKTVRDQDKAKQRKRRPDKDGSAPARPDARAPEGKGKSPKQPSPDAAKKTSDKGAPDAKRPSPPGPRPLTWKAPKRKDAKDDGGPKRWTGGRPESSGKPAKKPKGGAGKDEPAAKTPGGSRRPEGQKLTWKARKGGKRSAGPKRWTAGRPGGKATTGAKPASDYQDAAGSWRSPPPPPPGWEGMRPPPGADRAYRFERMERVDEPSGRDQSDKPARAVAGAPAAGWRALPAGHASSTPQSAPYEQGARSMSTPPPRTTQYGDAELTIYDVIEADADMAEEITDGVAEARATADGCERLITKLEAVHAKVIELKVPGVLAGWMVRLMDKTFTVKARANAIAESLPRAAEAIATAGSNAAARHKPLADAVRDAGHARPAEREYHDE